MSVIIIVIIIVINFIIIIAITIVIIVAIIIVIAIIIILRLWPKLGQYNLQNPQIDHCGGCLSFFDP